MPESILVTAAQSGTIAATTYHSLGYGFNTSNTTETNRQIKFRSIGVIKKLLVHVYSNASVTDSTITVRNNAADTSIVATVTALTTGDYQDTTHTASVADGDLLDYKCVNGTTGAISFSASVIFDCPTNNNMIYHNGNGVQNPTTGTYYHPIAGQSVLQTDETLGEKARARKSITLKKMGVYLSTNSRSTNHTMRSRKNGAVGAMTITLTASTAGWFEDTSNTDSLADGDDYNERHVGAAGTGTMELELRKIEVQSTDNIHLYQYIEGQSQTSAVTRYPELGFLSTITTESDAQHLLRIRGIASYLQFFVTANTLSGGSNSTITLRKNAADTALTFSITNGTTGLFEDSTHTVLLERTDKINLKILSGGTSGTLTYRAWGVWFNVLRDISNSGMVMG